MTKIKDIRIEQYDYALPDERIAKFPLTQRDQSKLLVYKEGTIEEDRFYNIPDYFQDNLLVYNNTKVIQARLHFRKVTGALIEIFCLEPESPKDYAMNFGATNRCQWQCLIGNSKKWKEGALTLAFTDEEGAQTITAKKMEQMATHAIIEFEWSGSACFSEVLDLIGELPIPPYLNRETVEQDKVTYQTVYSKIEGSVAAPTAGLHFTDKVFEQLDANGVKVQALTLHVGAGTFKPVKSETIDGHEMHTEAFSVTVDLLEDLLHYTGKVTAVGTTSVRTLESLYFMGRKTLNNPTIAQEALVVKQWEPYQKELPECTVQEALEALLAYMRSKELEALHTATQIIIVPGYQFKVVNRMITNFHQPRSTLLLLVSAFVKGDWMRIYEFALQHDFRFLSYGDSCLLLPNG